MNFILTHGGPVIYSILAVSVIILGIVAERMFHFRRAQIENEDFLSGIYNVLKKRNPAEAASLCNETPGPVSNLVQAAVLHHDEDVSVIREAVEAAGAHEMPRLEARMALMAVMLRTLPLLGILGTILGIIETLQDMEENAPLIYIGDVSSGVWQALLTTALALSIAIPGLLAYQFLIARMNSIIRDMDLAAKEILTFLATNRFKMTALVDEDDDPGVIEHGA